MYHTDLLYDPAMKQNAVTGSVIGRWSKQVIISEDRSILCDDVKQVDTTCFNRLADVMVCYVIQPQSWVQYAHSQSRVQYTHRPLWQTGGHGLLQPSCWCDGMLGNTATVPGTIRTFTVPGTIHSQTMMSNRWTWLASTVLLMWWYARQHIHSPGYNTAFTVPGTIRTFTVPGTIHSQSRVQCQGNWLSP